MMLLYITRVILGITTATKKNNPSRRYQTRILPDKDVWRLAGGDFCGLFVHAFH
jgi:hypothetical protein